MKPGLIGLLGKAGLLMAKEGEVTEASVAFGAFGVLNWLLNGRSLVPPSVLNASVRGVIGFNAPWKPGVWGTGYANLPSPVTGSSTISNLAHFSA